ncbi:MAG TPA: Flp1 family type IVb pilin [Clostridiales bacterium]|nr:Flp1 family type IVb pilin [Clostridiales bacterium]
MTELMKRFMKDEDGVGTVEIVVIIAVLVGIALIFRDAIIKFAVKVMKSVFGDDSIINDIKSNGIRNGNAIN